jgi:hypothetical protein
MRYGFGVVAAIVVMGLSPTGATAEEEVPLGFAEEAALTTTCSDLVDGVEVPIRNETAVPQEAHLVLGAFGGAEGKPVGNGAICGGLEVQLADSTLGAGTTTSARLVAKAATGSSFSGSLVLFGRDGRVARRELAIAVAPAVGLEATPLVPSISAERDHADPFDQGPVWVPVAIPAGEIPPLPASAPKTISVGALAGTNGTVAVTYSGETKPLTETTALVGVDLGGADPGSYSGTIDLLPGDDEKGAVALALTVTTWWPIPALVLLIGIGLGIWVQRQSGLRGPRARLLKRIEDLEQRHTDARAKLRKEANVPPKGPGDEAWGAFAITDLDELQKGLRERVDASTKKVAIQIDKTVLTDLEAKIGVVEGQIDLLEAVSDHAEGLEGALRKLESERPADLPARKGSDLETEEPALAPEARKALAGEAVAADELQKRLDAIDARGEEVRTLQRLEERLSDLWIDRRELDQLEDSLLTPLDAELDSIRHRLWSAEESEDLESAAEALQGTAKKVADLWHRLSPTRPVPLRIEILGMRARGVAAGSEVAEALAEVEAGAGAAPPIPPPPPPGLSAEEATRQIAKARANQWIVLLMGALVALASGLAALYVGKAWGSCWDYLAALIWGMLAQATVLALATSIDGLRALGRPGVER